MYVKSPSSLLPLLLSLLLATLPKADSLAQQSKASSRVDTLLVCAPDLIAAARPWVEFRTEQGHQIAIVSGAATKLQIKQEIVRLARTAGLQSVVLMGDAPVANQKTSLHVETHRVESNVIRKWGAEPSFPTDNYYADIDDDGLPELTIGRISADSPEALDGIIAKIIAYERSPNFNTWRRRVNFIAGVGGFGMLADSILETTAKKFITDGIPAEYRTSMTQASWRSPYSPDPRLFQAQTIERMNEGCLAWIYLGHGQKRGLDYYRVPDGGLPIFSTREVPQVASRAGSPIAVFLSCYTGAFDIEPDCLAEELLESTGGPVAVIAGTNVTMPYAMTVMGNAMLRELFDSRRATIGEVMLHAKRELGKPTEGQPRGLVDQLAKVISPDPDLLDEERAEHVQLFQLIGDPLLRIHHPKKVAIETPEYATAGDTIKIAGNSEVDGPCVIELVCRRDRMTFRPERRSSFEPTDAWLRKLQATYGRANDTAWTRHNGSIRDGQIATELSIPENATGPCHVRIYVKGKGEFAMGSSDVYLRPPPSDQPEASDDTVPSDQSDPPVAETDDQP